MSGRSAETIEKSQPQQPVPVAPADHLLGRRLRITWQGLVNPPASQDHPAQDSERTRADRLLCFEVTLQITEADRCAIVATTVNGSAQQRTCFREDKLFLTLRTIDNLTHLEVSEVAAHRNGARVLTMVLGGCNNELRFIATPLLQRAGVQPASVEPPQISFDDA